MNGHFSEAGVAPVFRRSSLGRQDGAELSLEQAVMRCGIDCGRSGGRIGGDSS
jgi:hypothetical protein